MYEKYNSNGVEYVLIRDVANKWYNTDCGKIPTTEVKNRIISNGFSVILVRAKIKQGNNFMNRDMFAVKHSDIEQINNLFSTNEILENKIVCSKYSFYIIQKYPNHAPSIIKMGKTSRTVGERSKEFNVYDVKILLENRIKSNNEKTLIDMISAGCKRLGEEEFWVEDITALLDRAKKVMALLPEPNSEFDEDEDDDDD